MNDPAGKSTVAATFFFIIVISLAILIMRYAQKACANTLCAESVRKYMIKYEYTLR